MIGNNCLKTAYDPQADVERVVEDEYTGIWLSTDDGNTEKILFGCVIFLQTPMERYWGKGFSDLQAPRKARPPSYHSTSWGFRSAIMQAGCVLVAVGCHAALIIAD